MDLDEATVYTTETKHNSSLTPLYAILQAKDHEADRHHSDQLIDQGKKKHFFMLFSSFYKTGTSLSLDTMNRCDTETIRFRIMNHNLWSDSWSKLCRV